MPLPMVEGPYLLPVGHVSRPLCVIRLLNVRLYFHLKSYPPLLSASSTTPLPLARPTFKRASVSHTLRPPLGPPPSHLNYPTTSQARIDSPQSINSVSVQGHEVVPSMRVDVGAANSYTDEADEEDITTPIRPSEKAPDAEPDEGVLRTSLTGVPLSSFWLTRFHRRYS